MYARVLGRFMRVNGVIERRVARRAFADKPESSRARQSTLWSSPWGGWAGGGKWWIVTLARMDSPRLMIHESGCDLLSWVEFSWPAEVRGHLACERRWKSGGFCSWFSGNWWIFLELLVLICSLLLCGCDWLCEDLNNVVSVIWALFELFDLRVDLCVF